MKTVLISLAALTALAASPAMAADVTVTLTGVQARGGTVLASLNTASTFLRGAGQYTARVAGDAAGSVTLVFHDVAPGEYALMVLHDENDNHRMDFGAAGPSEGWAFSNSARPMTGPPTFDDHKFAVGDQPVQLTETVRYGI